jgi:hypothetical protein
MRSRVATRLAWSLCALTLVLTAISVILLGLNYSHTQALKSMATGQKVPQFQ